MGSTKAGIAAVGFCLPRYVLEAPGSEGVVQRSAPGFDEDPITMAVEAGERALAAAGTRAVDVLAYATSGTAGGGALVAEALGIDPARARDVLGSPDGGETALAGALDAAGSGTSTLLIATDAPEGEPHGAAAVALLVTPDGRVPWRRGTSPSLSAIRSRVGEAGAATVLLSFLTGVEPSDVRGDVDVVRALKGRATIRPELYEAVRRRGRSPPGTEYSQGAYVSPVTYRAEAKARYRLVGERCTACGRLHFPPREACLGCGAAAWEDAPLRRTGTVYAFTVIGKGAAPSEFLEQQEATGEYATAVVALDDGPRVAAMLTDVEPKAVAIGMPVRMVFRRLYTQEGATRYGFKFAPA